jgi:hypothetical protein
MMIRTSLFVSLLVSLVCAPVASAALARAVTFEGLSVGDQFGPGAPGNEMSGDFLFTEDDIDVYVGDFLNTSGAVSNSPSAFVEVEDAMTGDIFPTNELDFFGNIAIRFDLTNLGFEFDRVMLDWADFGGSQTLSINGVGVGVNNMLDLPATLGGASITVTETGSAPGGVTGRLVLVGMIDSFTIGGQEFAIDEVLVLQVPTPGAGGLMLAAAVFGLRRARI